MREMTIQHLDELAEECIECGIFRNTTKMEPGIWSGALDTNSIYNHDEMPQFINYGINGHANGLVNCTEGEKCEKLRIE